MYIFLIIVFLLFRLPRSLSPRFYLKMASTEIRTTLPLTVSTLSSPTPEPEDHARYHMVLLSIYSVVLLTGTISLSLMVRIILSTTRSITSIAVLNLIFAHFLFLFTVPFRIYFYATNRWSLGHTWCKTVSGMIHIHMVMSFMFYVTILITRLVTFYRKTEQVAFFRRMHALAASVVLWMVVLVVVPCFIFFLYGRPKEESNNQTNNNSTSEKEPQCFQFGNIAYTEKILNYIMSTVIIAVATVLTALQANVLLVLYRKYGKGCTSQQDFWAQVKSLCFAVVMVMCFIPYHAFRLYYIGHPQLQDVNEVLLSLTTLNCLDMLTFLGKGTCYMCYRIQTL